MNGFLLFSAAGAFLYFTELEKFFVHHFLAELLEASSFTYVLTLFTAMVAFTTHAVNDARTLHTLGKTSNDVRAAFVWILFYLDV